MTDPSAAGTLVPARPLPRLGTGALVMAASSGSVVATCQGSVKVGAALAIGVPFTLLTSLRVKLVAYWTVLLLAGWAQVHYPSSGLKTVPAAVAVILVAHVVWEVLANRARLAIRHPYALLVALLAFITVVESRNPVTVHAGQSVSGLRTYLVPMGLFLVGLVLFRDRATVRLFLAVTVVVYLVVGLYALKQIVGGFDHAELAYWGAQPGTGVVVEKKVFSTLTSPDAFGFVSAATVLICLACRPLRILPRLSLVTGALAVAGVFTCGVRMATIALILGGLVLLVLQMDNPQTRNRAVSILLIALALALVGLTFVATTPTGTRQQLGLRHSPFTTSVQRFALLKKGTADPDLHGRLTRTGEFVTYLDHHPWGTGGGTSAIVIEQAIANNQQPKLPAYALAAPFLFNHDFLLFDYGFELGALGLFVFILVLLTGFIRAVIRVRAEVDDLTVAVIHMLTAAVVVTTLAHNLTNESFRDLSVSSYLWFLLASLVALRPAPDRTAVISDGGAPSGR